jgi:hypothetical protein
MGTPRNHKGLKEISEAVVALNDPATLFVIVGTFAPENQSLKQELFRIGGKQILFIEDQPFENTPYILSIADCCVIWQDIKSPISQYQVPAKLSDALASGVSILVNETPAIADLIKHKAFEVVEQSGEDVTVKSEPKPIKVKRCDLKSMLREGDEVTTTEGEYGRVSSQLGTRVKVIFENGVRECERSSLHHRFWVRKAFFGITNDRKQCVPER